MTLLTHRRVATARWSRRISVGAVVLVVSCDGPTEPNLPLYPDVSNFVAGAAAAALDEDGRFRIPDEIGDTPEGVPLSSAARAASLARAFVHSFGHAFLPSWQHERGRAVNLAALTPSARVFPIVTPYEAVPDLGCHPAIAHLFGSFYLMTLDAPEPEVHMAVSAQTTDYGVDSNGDLVEPPRTGNDFFHTGIPASGTRLITPEQAVAVTAHATGALIVEVPHLARRDISWSPTAALWRITLDRDVVVRRADGTQTQARDLFVGVLAEERFFVPALEQPSVQSAPCHLIDENLVDHGTTTVTVTVRSGYSVQYELVSIIR